MSSVDAQERAAIAMAQANGPDTLDYFAQSALQGLLARCWHPDMGVSPVAPADELVSMAYKLAEAMLAEKVRRQMQAKGAK